MRDYYEKILAYTYVIFGVNQLEKMNDDQLQFLLDGLEGVSRLYSYIPEEFQKKIIRARMLKDKDYRNINLNVIARWFEEDGKIFFTQKHHEENKTNPNYKPLEGEERDKALEEWKKTLQNVTANFTGQETTGSGTRLRHALDDKGIKFDETKHDKHAVKSFFIDGFEIYASSLEDAERIYKENFGTNEQTNQQAEPGIKQDSESAESSSNPEQQS